MPKATLQSKWRVGVPIAFAVLGAILLGILVARKSGDEALENATQVAEKSEIVRRVSTPEIAVDIPKTTARQKRLTKGAVLHHAVAVGRRPSDRKASAISEGTGRRDVIESENAFMARLREMWMVQPEVALRMADEGEHRFKDTLYAAECAWIAVRAMVEMGDFASAKEKSEEMVETYHGTRWAMDVQRHMLSHPPNE
jgi:hypothetical protein